MGTANPIVAYPLTGGSATLPSATGAGQVLTSTGAGTTYTAQNPAVVLIQKQILATTSATVTFSSIPQTFSHLRIVAVGQSSAATVGLNLIFNGDTGTNYNFVTNTNNNGGFTTTANTSSTSFGMGGFAAGGSNSSIVEIPVYSQATFSKGVICTNEINNPAGPALFRQDIAGGWSGTAAVTSITITIGSTFVVGSSFYLYGIQ